MSTFHTHPDKPQVGDIYYLDMWYSVSHIGISVEVIGRSSRDADVFECCPVAGDRTSFWVEKRHLYTRHKEP